MAGAVGLGAQRINLSGEIQHIVPEVEVAPGVRLVADTRRPPYVPVLKPLDRVIPSPVFDDYYTLNRRRLRLRWFVSRVRMEMSPFTTYGTENPHALKAILWILLAASLLMLKALRVGLRAFLLRRGWGSTSPTFAPFRARWRVHRRVHPFHRRGDALTTAAG